AELSGSNSLSSSVPSDLRRASTLAIWPLTTQLVRVVGGWQSVPSGLWSKNVAEVLVVASTPRVGEVTATELPLIATAPLKSSIRSSWLAPRLAFVFGRATALQTPGLGEEGCKCTDRAPPESAMASL